MIDSKEPVTWEDLQNSVSKILLECGLKSETPKKIQTVRGIVEVDVYAVDYSLKPSPTYLCECKYWKRTVPQTVIHAFHDVVNNFGANWGLVISSNGYQSGAFEAAKNTNIRLLDWIGFQNVFEERWYKEYFQRKLEFSAEPLIEYTEPMNSRIFRKADLLSFSAQKEFDRLRTKYNNIALFALSLRHSKQPIKFPLNLEQNRHFDGEDTLLSELLEVLLEVEGYRDLLEILLEYINNGLEEFDSVFGYRA